MPIRYTREEKRQIAVERGIVVDPEDMWLLEEYTWHIGSNDYPKTNLPDGKYAFLHHAIVGYPVFSGEEVDHINRNPRDNRRSNLRYVSHAINVMNTARAPGPSNHRNIYLKEGRYNVRIRRNTVEHHIGRFDTVEEAVTARDAWLQHVVGSE